MSGEDIVISMELLKTVRSKKPAGRIASGKYKLKMRNVYIAGSLFWLTIIAIIIYIFT